MIFNVRSAQQEPPTFSVRIDRPSTTWLLTLNVSTEPHRQFCPLIKVVSNVTIMLKKREKGGILQSNSTMNGKSDKKINKYRATDGWKMQTIWSVCSTARFSFMSQYSRGYSFSGTFKIPAQLQQNKTSLWQIFWRHPRNCSSCRTSDQKLRPARFPSNRPWAGSLISQIINWVLWCPSNYLSRDKQSGRNSAQS